MLSLHHILAIALFATTLVGCERSSRNVDVQPSTNKLPNSNGDGKGGTNPDNGGNGGGGNGGGGNGGGGNGGGGNGGGGNGGGGNGGGGNGGGGSTPTPTPVPGTPTPTPNPNGGDTDVLINPNIGGNPQTATWDGKSFLGNSKWQIEAVN